MALKRPEFPPDTVEENGSLVQVFLHRAKFFGSKKALHYKTNGTYDGFYTWTQWAEKVCETAMGLYELGVRKGDPVGIFSENRPEWTFADMGALSLGAVVVPIYPTSSPDDIRYIIEHAKLKVLFVGGDECYSKIKIFETSFLPGGVIVFSTKNSTGGMSFSSFLERGRAKHVAQPEIYEQSVQTVGPNDLATIIYTSGTTGAPKGVMLTHRNFIANYQGSFQRIVIDDRDSLFSFLPLSHSFERLAGYYYQLAYGVSIAYAESMTTVADDIRLVQPTIVVAVPRFYEKIHARIQEEVSKAPRWKQGLFRWATRIGTRMAQIKIRRQQKAPRWLIWANHLAKVLVFNKIKQAMGGRIRLLISGGAPLSKDLARFFYAADMTILEGYGLTETSPVIAVNALDDVKFGTVGKVIPNIQVKIAEDGEIMTAGPCVMQGYFENPEATAAAIRDGWFYTGDIGFFDPEGFLHITDRKKDIIVTAGGKNISPQNIESRILTDSLFVQVVVLGDKRPYLCALIVPNRNEVLNYARSLKIGELSYEEILKHPEMIDWIRKRMETRMEGLANYELVKAFLLLAKEFSQAAGEVTPTLKLKRRVIMKEYQQAIDELYRRTDEDWARRKTPGLQP